MRTKTIVIAGLLLLLIMAVAACSSNEAVETKKTETSASTESPGETEEKRVSTVNGEVAIPTHPQRIVATYYMGELAALGIKPVGTVTRQLGEASPNLAAYTKEVADIGASPNLEAIVGLNPDLIIATDFDNIDYADYAKIAPTVIIPWINDDVWDKLRTFAKLFDKEDEAETFIQDYEVKAVKARETIEGVVAKNETVSIIRFFGKSIRVYGGRDIGHAIYNGLQLTPPAIIKDAMAQDANFNSTQDISLEEIPQYAGDRIFVVVTDADGDSAYKAAQQLSIWSNLPAVKNNKVYEIPADKWFAYDPITVNITLDEAVRILTRNGSK
jgi:iron complex transport system substrate-binding protein